MSFRWMPEVWKIGRRCCQRWLLCPAEGRTPEPEIQIGHHLAVGSDLAVALERVSRLDHTVLLVVVS